MQYHYVNSRIFSIDSTREKTLMLSPFFKLAVPNYAPRSFRWDVHHLNLKNGSIRSLCWLRPSCLPSQPPKDQNSKTTASFKTFGLLRPKAKPKLQNVAKHSTPIKNSNSKRLKPPPAVTSANITIQASKPFVTLSYIEPTTKANGLPLNKFSQDNNLS